MTFKRAFNNIERKLKRVTTNKRVLNEIGEFLIQDIVATTRKGRVVEDERFTGNPKLETSTKNFRRKYATVNKTGLAFSPNKSNLTFTGELLESITKKVSGSKLTVFAKGFHKRYIGLRGKPIGKIVKNSDIIKWQSEKGRIIFSITKNRAARIRGFIREAIKRL